MEEDLAFARSAAIKFLNTLHDARDITLVDFDTEVRVARFGQSEFPRLVERIRTRKADGYTALYDALGVYLDGASSQDGRKILVLYTDGGDNASSITLHRAARPAQGVRRHRLRDRLPGAPVARAPGWSSGCASSRSPR